MIQIQLRIQCSPNGRQVHYDLDVFPDGNSNQHEDSYVNGLETIIQTHIARIAGRIGAKVMSPARPHLIDAERELYFVFNEMARIHSLRRRRSMRGCFVRPLMKLRARRKELLAILKKAKVI